MPRPTKQQIAAIELRCGAEDAREGVPCDDSNVHEAYLRGYAMQYELDQIPPGHAARFRLHSDKNREDYRQMSAELRSHE